MKDLNRIISIIEAHIGLIWFNMGNKKCYACDHKQCSIKYSNISPETNKWDYKYHCSYCGKEHEE